MEPVLLRVQEAAKLLRVSKWTVYRWIEEGRLRATKIGGGSLRVFRTSVQGLIGDVESPGSRESNNQPPSTKLSRGVSPKRTT